MVENQFMQCFIKESKHAYKECIKWGVIGFGTVLGISVLIALLLMFRELIVSFFGFVFLFIDSFYWIIVNSLYWIPLWAYLISILIMLPAYGSYYICLQRFTTQSQKENFIIIGFVGASLFGIAGIGVAGCSFMNNDANSLMLGIIMLCGAALVLMLTPTKVEF